MRPSGARFSREQLIFKALCVLHQTIDEARRGAVEPNYGLRFALAFLFAVSDDRLGIAKTDREVFDQFWACVTGDPSGQTPYMTHYVRTTNARTHMTGICRRVGMPLTVELDSRLLIARGVVTERPWRPYTEAAPVPAGEAPSARPHADQAGPDQQA